jgi:hypothetical protein
VRLGRPTSQARPNGSPSTPCFPGGAKLKRLQDGDVAGVDVDVPASEAELVKPARGDHVLSARVFAD